ncbi:MAG: enolase C-terminal domain-like protein [Acidiferrobacteraceae bacterium]
MSSATAASPLGLTAPAIGEVRARGYRIPTVTPESDGTLSWDATVIVVVEVSAGPCHGIGYSYGEKAMADVVRGPLAAVISGRNSLDVEGCWLAMARAMRNAGRPGLVSGALSAVDTALWDLKAKIMDLPLALLLGRARERVDLYGSGGFTSYTGAELEDQLGGWAARGFRAVKMKVGREPLEDASRVHLARRAIGDCTLMVDANGAYDRKQALALAERFAEDDVSWFEEPVSSNDLEGLSLLRDRAPAGMELAAGEYGYDIGYFRRMLDAGAVDVLQADATRCGGLSVFLKVGALCEAYELPLSSHTAPSLHLHACCALKQVRHMEYFVDHVRVEQRLFDGVVVPVDGMLSPDLSRPGLGLDFKWQDAARYAA